MALNYASRILANSRVKCTGVVDSNIKLELFNAVDEFCKQTNHWQEDIPVTVVAGDNVVYDLVPTLGSPLRLISLKITDSKIPVLGSMGVPGELLVDPTVAVGTALTATISLFPLDPLDTDPEGFPVIADWMWPRYYQEFTDGVLYKLLTQQDKPWTNAQLGAFHGQRWRNALGTARADGGNKNVADGQAWRFPTHMFAGRGSQRQ